MMSTAFIEAVLQTYPQSQVDLIVKSGFHKLPLPLRGKVLEFNADKISARTFGQQLQKEQYDCFFVLPPSFSSAWMAYHSKASYRVGYEGEFRTKLLNPALEYRIRARSRHLIDEYFDLLPQFVNRKLTPSLSIDAEWLRSQTFPYELPQKYIVLAPAAIYGPSKQWPVAYFRKLAEEFEEHQIEVIIIGTANDIHLGNQIAGGLSNVYNWCGKTSLTTLVALLYFSELLVSNDSGAMHVMAALQKPQIAIFGSTSPTWTSPKNEKAIILHDPPVCSPCFQRLCKFGHYACLWGITPQQVFQKANSLFHAKPK